MASIKIPLFLQSYTPKIARFLIFTFLEWTLISLLFLNCVLFFLIVKFASFSGLETPCIHCSLSAFRISFNTLICNDHMTRISKFKRAQRKRNIKDTRGFDYVIYGPPWRVVEYAKNGNVIHKRIKREIGKDHCFFEEEENHKPDFVKENSLETMHTRLIPVELIDEVTLKDSSIWFNEEKQHKREFTAHDGKTKLRNEARDGISAENYSLRKDHVGEGVNKTTNQSQNTHSFSSLFEIAPMEMTLFSNLCIRSEPPPPPQLNELEEHTKNTFSSKSLDSSLVKRNKENTDREIFHSQAKSTNSYRPIFEITPIETTSLVNPDIASEQISDKYDELDASEVKKNEEEIKGELLIKFSDTLEKSEEERCSIIEKLNQLEQRLLIVQLEESKSEHMIEEAKPNFQVDYKSLSDFLNREMNYSTNDLVNLGKGHNQRRGGNLKMKKHLPLSHGLNLKKGVTNSLQEEIDKLHERLEHIDADRELIKQCVKSLKKKS